MEGVNEALEAAVDAIYFKDNADYLPALWQVVKALKPLAYRMLPVDPRTAFLLYGSGRKFDISDRVL